MPRKKPEGIFKCMRRLIMERIVPGEIPDPTPIHIPGAEKPLTIQEEMKRFIREEIGRAAYVQESAESFEEADDFEDEEDQSDLLSAYTVIELRPEAADYDPNPTTDSTGEESESQMVPETGSEAPEPPTQSIPADQSSGAAIQKEAVS